MLLWWLLATIMLRTRAAASDDSPSIPLSLTKEGEADAETAVVCEKGRKKARSSSEPNKAFQIDIHRATRPLVAEVVPSRLGGGHVRRVPTVTCSAKRVDYAQRGGWLLPRGINAAL